MRPLDTKTFLADTLRPYATGERSGLPDELERYLLDESDRDREAIKTRLAEVKAVWDRSVSHPRYGELSRQLSALHKDAMLTLLDDSERARLVASRGQRRAEEQQAAERAMDEWRSVVASYVANGGLTPQTRAVLEQLAAGNGLDPDRVRAELDRAPVAAPDEAQFDAEALDRIRSALESLDRLQADGTTLLHLFDRLGLSPTTDVSVIRNEYDAQDSLVRNLPHGQLATAHKNVLSLIKLHLLDADPRRYVDAVITQVRDSLSMSAALAASDGTIDATEAESLTQAAMQRGLTADQARRMVVDLARQHGASLQTGETVDYVSCPSCRTPHPRASAPAACRHCSTALFLTCPATGCGTTNDATALACGRCSADLRGYRTAQRDLAGLQTALDEGRVAQAEVVLTEATRVLGSDAVPAGLAAGVRQRAGEARGHWETVDASLAARRLYDARRVLQTLQTRAHDTVGAEGRTPRAVLNDLGRRLAEVDAALTRARAAAGPSRERQLLLALDIATDCREAADLLAASPLGPPGAVTAQFDGQLVAIAWDASPALGVEYTVHRVDGSRRDEISRLAETSAYDRGASGGATVRYEVRARRGASTSTPSISAPVLIATGLEDVRVEDGDRRVRITWRPVDARAQVVARRVDDMGASRDLRPGRSELADDDVQNGRQYAYHLGVEYPTPDGRPRRTPVQVVHAQPASPPLVLTDLRVERVAGGVLVRYDRPPTGRVLVFRTAADRAQAPGTQLRADELAAWGTPIRETVDGAIDDRPVGRASYQAVTVAGGVAVVGASMPYLALEQVTDVQAWRQADTVRVTWRWPADLGLVKVLWRPGTPPVDSNDPAASWRWLSLGEYRDAGGLTLPVAGGTSLHVAVAAADPEGGGRAESGVPPSARASVTVHASAPISYQVRQRRDWRRRFLVVEVDGPEQRPCGLSLQAVPGDLLPRSITQGETLGVVAPGDRQLEIDVTGRSRPFVVRLFPVGAKADGVRVIDPSTKTLVVT